VSFIAVLTFIRTLATLLRLGVAAALLLTIGYTVVHGKLPFTTKPLKILQSARVK
jgi:hypothetical protein